MTYTFDEAFKCVKENSFIQSYEDVYEYNHVIDLDDVIEILENLEQEYAPTVEMKPYQFEVFKQYRYGVRKGDIDFGGIWSDKPYRMMNYFKEESYTGTTIWDDSFAKAWLHPETIKVIEENQ